MSSRRVVTRRRWPRLSLPRPVCLASKHPANAKHAWAPGMPRFHNDKCCPSWMGLPRFLQRPIRRFLLEIFQQGQAERRWSDDPALVCTFCSATGWRDMGPVWPVPQPLEYCEPLTDWRRSPGEQRLARGVVRSLTPDTQQANGMGSTKRHCYNQFVFSKK